MFLCCFGGKFLLTALKIPINLTVDDLHGYQHARKAYIFEEIKGWKVRVIVKPVSHMTNQGTFSCKHLSPVPVQSLLQENIWVFLVGIIHGQNEPLLLYCSQTVLQRATISWDPEPCAEICMFSAISMLTHREQFQITVEAVTSLLSRSS